MALGPDRRFRLVNDYASGRGFVSGFPNFHEADYGQGVVGGVLGRQLCQRVDRLGEADDVGHAVRAALEVGLEPPPHGGGERALEVVGHALDDLGAGELSWSPPPPHP